MDDLSFERQLTGCADMMYRIAISLLKNTADCEDALQESALKAWQSRHTLKDDRRFHPWLARIVVNECYAILRHRKRRLPLDAVPEPASAPPDPTLALALSRLPEKARLLLLLHYAEGMDYDDLQQVFSLPKATLRARVHRAKEMLRKELI